MVLCVGLSIAVQAMPTEAEIAKVRPVIDELTAGDRAAMKSGKKTPAQLAETLLSYVKDAESEAAKYVLMREAFGLYLDAGDTKKAIDTVRRMEGIVGSRIVELHERIGLAFASKGQWDFAFTEFGKAGGRIAEIVDWEKAYPATGVTELTTDAVGDFWWSKAEEHTDKPKVAAALRVHAAKWLREALKNGSVRGLKKTLAERRIAEVEKDSGSVPPASGVTCNDASLNDATIIRLANRPDGQELINSTAVKVTKPAGKPMTLNLGKGVKIDFLGCPAGEFMMGRFSEVNRESTQFPSLYYHRVKVTRPFWLSKYLVTHEVWNAYQKVKLTKEDKVLGGMKRTHCVAREEMDAFCEWLMKRYGRGLPTGYVFRAPTEAEWDLAFKTDLVNSADPYVEMRNDWMGPDNLSQGFSSYLVLFEDDVLPKLQKAGLAESRGNNRFEGYILGCEVGTKKPNPWGFYDMIGIRGELMLDTVDSGKWPLQKKSDKVKVVQTAFRYDDEETDPLRYFSDVPKRAEPLIRGGRNINWFYYRAYKTTPWYFLKGKIGTVHYNLYLHPFRVCIGPDLIKEKGCQKLKAGKR